MRVGIMKAEMFAVTVAFAIGCGPLDTDEHKEPATARAPSELPSEQPEHHEDAGADAMPPGDPCGDIRHWCHYPDPWDPNYDATYVWPSPSDPGAIAVYGQPKCYCMCQNAPDPMAFCRQKVDANGNPVTVGGAQVANDCGTLFNAAGTTPFFPQGWPLVCRVSSNTVPSP